ncbi:5-deoxy-glucuronate isomerase [Kineococcus xinjiangensis]|uniref:5-deoxy-glucuronate isomerase n=1 Tax=Kineococcus xinjiangensis TaxID=512762 RepID=A0A2S6IUC6_9ACTN|nr:5-deoxy-glucuronate isomerase [Kineococcus xinjiangensis]PPK97875.1 5-deoxy-glucuronate isomerase [Kineococcus xinjiangensis]
MGSQHHLPAGSAAGDGFDVVVTPESAGWGFSSLRTLTLAAGEEFRFPSGEHEVLVLPLGGGCTVEVDGEVLELAGRPGVFDGVSDFAYVPRDSSVLVRSAGGGRFALPGARASRRLPFRYGPASAVPVELRGAGTCSRQVNNFATPEAFETDKLIACEVLTPGGNWSSYPPHRHDRTSAQEAELEEVYYFEFRSGAPEGAPSVPGGVGYQRVYGDGDRPIDVLAEVRSGDVVLIPHGWHGPSMAVPGYDMYYLNVMAGPEPERSWRICDDPAHGWVRATWAGAQVDPRLPFCGPRPQARTS